MHYTAVVQLERGRFRLAPLPRSPASPGPLLAAPEREASRWAVLRDGAPCSSRQWIDALREQPEARQLLTELLRASPFRAYLWESTPALPDDSVAAELALTESHALARAQPDPSSFAAQFRASDGTVATFANLGGDAVMVAPHPAQAPDSAHLAAFVRSAADPVVDALWRAVAVAVSDWLTTRRRPAWLSTSGLAVPWLHVRIDSVPKYYAHRPYAQLPAAK